MGSSRESEPVVIGVHFPTSDRAADPVGAIVLELPELGPEWTVVVTPRVTESGPVIESLTIRPTHGHTPAPNGLTREHLDRIQVRTLRSAIRNAVTMMRSPENPLRDRTPAGLWDQWEMQQHPGRAGNPDLMYAALAAQYVDLVTSTAQPVRELGKAHQLSEARVRGLLTEARSRGLLTPAPSGRAGGTLTDKARELLGGGT